MAHATADTVICGAGIAGIATAYHLAVRRGVKRIILIDERAPLTLTSDKSTECYRNWWPGPGDAMVSLMNRSIDLMEELAHESGNLFNLNRRGYLFATADPARIETFRLAAEEAASLGAGPVRYHTGLPGEATYVPVSAQGFADPLTGADIILDRDMIRQHFSYLSERTVAVLHARRCGWFSAQQFGMYLLEQARAHGVELLAGRVETVDLSGNRIQAVRVDTQGESRTIYTDNFVNAAGPVQKKVARMIGVDLPVFSELHVKIAFNDHLGLVPPMRRW